MFEFLGKAILAKEAENGMKVLKMSAEKAQQFNELNEDIYQTLLSLAIDWRNKDMNNFEFNGKLLSEKFEEFTSVVAELEVLGNEADAIAKRMEFIQSI